MNYKVMQRPMFRLGGSARKNYQNGTTLEDLIKQRSELRDKAYGAQRTLLPLSVLASQMDDVRTIRKPGDILNIFSNIGGSKELFGALGKLGSIDLKKSEGELTDKIALEKINISKNKKTATELKLNAARDAQTILSKYGSVDQIPPQERTRYFDNRKIAVGDLTPGEALKLATLRVSDQEARKDITDVKLTEEQKRKEIQDLARNLLMDQSSIFEREMDAEGGRVGFQQGTPDPMVMPQPKPQEAVQDRQLDTLMDAAPALENPNEAKSMGEKDMYNALRRRLPKEISDDVVRLIAYNQEAFADFANISDQSDVESFNQKYNVELVLPVGNQ
jgi:hypothetical protein